MIHHSTKHGKLLDKRDDLFKQKLLSNFKMISFQVLRPPWFLTNHSSVQNNEKIIQALFVQNEKLIWKNWMWKQKEISKYFHLRRSSSALFFTSLSPTHPDPDAIDPLPCCALLYPFTAAVPDRLQHSIDTAVGVDRCGKLFNKKKTWYCQMWKKRNKIVKKTFIEISVLC